MSTPNVRNFDPGHLDGSIWTKAFWKGAAERAIKTFAQSVLGAFGVLEGFNLVTAEQDLGVAVWQAALLVALVNAALSVFTSIANPGFVAGGPVRLEVEIPGVAGPGVAGLANVPDGTGSHRATDELDAEVAALRQGV